MSDWIKVHEFEKQVAEFFGAPYGVAVDSCTHGLELCLRLLNIKNMFSPKRTYLSVPMLANKLNIDLTWRDENWLDFYYLTPQIIDAAVLWQPKSYVAGTFMSISFQYQKHLSLGRGGMILTDNKEVAAVLKKMSYDGRLPGIPWREQNVDTMGFHYYMTPDTAQLGLDKLPDAIKTVPRKWTVYDWPDLTKMEVFKKMVVPERITVVSEITQIKNHT